MQELMSRAAMYDEAMRERFGGQRPRQHRLIRPTRTPFWIVACDWAEEYGETRSSEVAPGPDHEPWQDQRCPFCADHVVYLAAAAAPVKEGGQ